MKFLRATEKVCRARAPHLKGEIGKMPLCVLTGFPKARGKKQGRNSATRKGRAGRKPSPAGDPQFATLVWAPAGFGPQQTPPNSSHCSSFAHLRWRTEFLIRFSRPRQFSWVGWVPTHRISLLRRRRAVELRLASGRPGPTSRGRAKLAFRCGSLYPILCPRASRSARLILRAPARRYPEEPYSSFRTMSRSGIA